MFEFRNRMVPVFKDEQRQAQFERVRTGGPARAAGRTGDGRRGTGRGAGRRGRDIGPRPQGEDREDEGGGEEEEGVQVRLNI